MPIVECVPNFSEGRNSRTLETITNAISLVDGVKLLDVDSGNATNRTVVTFVGEPEAVLEAAFQAIAQAAKLIDMRNHNGAHPRIGATDVCPFVPVSGLSMQDCVDLAKRLGARVGEELSIPVYLYAEAATRTETHNLADIRQGEYEGLAERMLNGFFPDYGPTHFNPVTGATVIGARSFLIAYNVNLNTKSRRLANQIALNIRESGKVIRDKEGVARVDEEGNVLRSPGLLKACKAVGWYVEDYQRAQVSLNLTDYHTTSMHSAFEEVCRQAEMLGLRVTGSEIVGLVPLEPMLMAGKYYLSRQGRCTGVSELELVQTAILSLGLSDVAQFKPEKKIIEYILSQQNQEQMLKNMTITQFMDELASDSTAPGGGSVAALIGALSASLSSMVANISYEKKGFEEKKKLLDDTACQAQRLKVALVAAIDEDTQAFRKIGEARRLPKESDANKAIRDAAIEEANKAATMVPFRVLEVMLEAIKIVEIVIENSISAALSDIGVAAITAFAAAEGAYYNVLTNLAGISDKAFYTAVYEKAQGILDESRLRVESLRKRVLSSLQ